MTVMVNHNSFKLLTKLSKVFFFKNIAITCQSEPYRKSSGKMACAIPINEKLTVKKAAEICQSKGAFLPFITTAREQRYLNHKRKKVLAISY